VLFLKNLKGKQDLGDTGIDGKIILKRIPCTGFRNVNWIGIYL
jgi:hypothetical protein